MEIEMLSKHERSMQLLIQGTDVQFLNALRRIAISEVPCMAIDEVVIIENSSVLQDETIAHRIGLIPLKTDLDNYNLPEECACKSEFGCSLCRVSLTFDAEAKDETRPVYSGELIPETSDTAPVSDKIPIVKLAKKQRLKLEAYARLGKGKSHARWQPVSKCTYKYYPELSINGKTCDACGKCVDICAKRVLAKSEGKIVIRNLVACTLCQDCADVCPKDPAAIEVGWKKGVFIFNIESAGGLPPERIMDESLKLLNGQLKEFATQLKVKKE